MNPYLNLFRQLILVLMSFVATSAYAQTEQEAIKGGVCVVRVDDKVVLVHEILTKKLALPGGRVERGEDPAITAQRETWEETGLVVSVKRELGRYDDAIFYDCVRLSYCLFPVQQCLRWLRVTGLVCAALWGGSLLGYVG